MDTLGASERLAALGHETRLSIFRLLVPAGAQGLSAGVIGERLGLAAATLSFHLAHLARVGLIHGRQESRFIFYSVDFPAIDDLLAYLTENCCSGAVACLPRTTRAGTAAPAPDTSAGAIVTEQRPWNILILCTGNSARSIMAEALFNVLGEHRFRAWSAGSRPTGKVNPLAVENAAAIGYPTSALRSKSWDEFAGPGAPEMDFVITVCDNAAGETCPLWPGKPLSAHWSFEDPAAVEGDEGERRRAFGRVFAQIRRRVELFVSLPLATLDRMAIKREMDRIGSTPRVPEGLA